MPSIKISEFPTFPNLDSPELGDILPILDITEIDPDLKNKKATISDILDLVVFPPGEVNTASNIGIGQGIFSNKIGEDLQFRTLIAGNNIGITSNVSTITIDNTAPLGEINTASNLGLGQGIYKNKTLLNLEFKSLIAGTNISLTSSDNDITINSTVIPGEINTASNLGTGSFIFNNKIGPDLQFKSLVAGTGISLTQNSNNITISNNSPGEVNTASNLGIGQNVYATKTGSNLEFKTLTAGSGITLTSTPTEINIVNNTSTVSFNTPISTNTVLNNNFHNKFVQINTQSNNVTITLSNNVQDGFTCFLFHNKGTGSNQIIINNNTLTFLSRGTTIQNPAATASLIYNATTSTWYGVGDLI